MKNWACNITIELAKTSTFPKFKHGCVIEKGGRVVSRGVNTPKPRTPNSSFSVHAEIQPLKRLLTMLARSKRGGTYELYVARVNPTDKTANSKPCPKCMEALKRSGVICKIHYTADNGWESLDI